MSAASASTVQVLKTHHLAIGSGFCFHFLVVSVVRDCEPVAKVSLLNERHVTLSEVLEKNATSSGTCTMATAADFTLTDKYGFIACSFSLPCRPSIQSRRLENSEAAREHSFASSPVTATMRRIPLAMEDSSVITKSLMSSVLATCL